MSAIVAKNIRPMTATFEKGEIFNIIRKEPGLQDLKVNINNKEIPIFPSQWEKYEFSKIKDACLIPREGIKATGRWSWWMVYKWTYLAMFLISIVMLIHLYYP